jgi:serine/threonine protein kinase
MNEIIAMSSIDHPNVVKAYGVDWDASFDFAEGRGEEPVYALCLELAKGGMLFDLVYNLGRLSDSLTRTYFHQLLEAIEACHSAGIIHRDLKPENILLSEDYSIKVADFGLSHIHDPNLEIFMKTKVGTISYMAPEVLRGRNFYNEKADIFSMGVILFVLHTRLMPFEHATKDDWWYSQIINGKPELFWAAHCKSANISVSNKEYKNLVVSMLSPDPNERPSLEEIKATKWYNKGIVNQSKIKKAVDMKNKKIEAQKKKTMKRRLDDSDRSAGDDIVAEDIDVPLYNFSTAMLNRTSFWSKQSPKIVAYYISELLDSFDMDCEFSGENGFFKVNIEVPHNDDEVLVKFSIQVYKSDEFDLSFIEFVKVSGDVFVYNKLYEKIERDLSAFICDSPYKVDIDMTDDELAEMFQEEVEA